MATLIDDATATRYFNEIDNAPEDERQLMADSLIAWGNSKQEQEYNATDEHFSKLFTDESYFEQEKQANAAVQESLDPDQTAKSAAIGAWLEHRMGRPIDTMSYQVERDAYAMANYGKKNLDDAQFFDFVRGEYDWQKKKTEAINDLQMQAVAKAINDSQLGQNRPFVDGMTEVFNEWQSKYPELVDGQNDAAFLSQGYKLYYDTINDLDTVRPQASKALSTLTAFTQGNSSDEELQSLANDFVGAPPEDRQKIYKYVTLAAQAGQIDRAGLEQFAVNMGQAFTRGFDFIPQGSLQIQESGVNEVLQAVQKGQQVWVPQNGDLTKATVAEKTPKAQVLGQAPTSGMFATPQDGYREATPEEADQFATYAKNAMESFKVVRELRNVAKTGVDPIRPVLEEDTFWGTAERGAYGLSGSIPLMGATAVNPYLGVLAYQATEYDRIMLENPDIDPQFAQGLALVEGAANAAIDRVQLKSLSGKLPMFGRYLDRIKSDGIRRTIKIGANVVEQNLQEGAQDLIAPVLETAVAALRDDMPDKDFTKLMDEWGSQRAETFFATLPLALIGGGIATYQDIKNPSAELNATKLRQAGMSPDQITFIQRADNPEEYTARIGMEWEKRTEENIAAGRQEVIAEMQKAATPGENDARISETVAEDGTRRWVVTAPDGRELLQTQDQQAALEAVRQHGEAQLLNQQFQTAYEPQELRQMIGDLSNQWTSENSDNTLVMESEGMNAQQKLEQLQAAGNAAQIQELHNRIANSPYKDTPYDQINILGEASVQDVAEMVWKPLITINPNTRPENLREEIHHIGVKVALKNGRVTLDTLRGWLEATEAALPDKFQNLVRETEGDIIESFAQVQAAYENGKINADEETKLPASFVDYIKNMMRAFAEVMRRAVALKGAFKDGILPAEYESFLADSVGLNQQTLTDTVRDRAKTDLVTNGGQMLMDFSIGSRSSAVSTDTPSIRASNATITGPANYSIGAFHGTPHKVDKFSTEKIGTGEGAQAYGWGLYFAEEKKVATGYRDALSGVKLLDAKGDALVGLTSNPVTQKILKEAQSFWKNGETTLPSIISEITQKKRQAELWASSGSNVQSNTEFVSGSEEALRLLQGGSSAKIDGNLYTVDLDVEPEDLLDWDKPLSEQTESVRDAVTALINERVPKEIADVFLNNVKAQGGSLYTLISDSFGESAQGTPAKRASEALFAAGIPGIRYLDGGSRGPVQYKYEVVDNATGDVIKSFHTKSHAIDFAAGEDYSIQINDNPGTYNYVIFDESKIKITGENGQPVTMQDAQPVSADTGATNYSISVQTTAANILADRLKIPTTLGKEYAGRQIIPIEADLTAGGGSFTQKPAQGGPAFSVIPEYFNAGVAWAAAKDGFWTGKLNLARESGAIYIGKDGREKFMVAPYAMKQDSHISNPTVAGEKLAEVARYVAEGRISPEQEKGLSDIILKAAGSISEKSGEKIEQLTNEIPKHETALEKLKKKIAKEEKALKAKASASGKELTKQEAKALEKALKELNKPADEIADQLAKAVKDLKKFKTTKTMADGLKTFPTTFVAGQFDQYLAKLSFEQRAFIAEKLSSAAAEKLGAPPMEQIRRATLDESFSGTENLSLISLLEIDVPRLEKGLKDKTLTAESYKVTPHNSYNSLAPGRIVAMFRTPIPYALAFPDIKQGLSNWAKAKNKADNNHGYYLKGKIPEGVPKTQEITSQMLNLWSASQTNLRPNQAKAIVAALNQKWTTFDKPRQAGLAEFTRAIRNNDAAVTLTQYSEKEVSQLLKAGTMKVYRLGEMNVWFALKRPTGDEFDPGDSTKDWTIVSVINNEKAAPGVLPLIMSKALAEGGTRLDCYAVKSAKYPEGLLPTLYARSGFEPTANYPFDESYHTEPGKMGELEKVWHSQNWDGQNRPPLVYMKWNPELHANLGTNARDEEANAKFESYASEDGRGMARGQDSRIGRVAEGSSVSMGGEGQGEQGGRVSNGPGLAGDAGNARNILPRGIEQIVADLGKLNDYQLQALGLTKSEVDDAIGIYNDPNSVSYSIASQSEIDRVNRALGGMNRGPDARLAVYERAREKFSLLQAWNRDELQAMQETGADDTTIRRSQILQGLGELDAILSILPPEVRGRVGGYTKLASIAPHDVLKDGVKVSEVSGMNGAIISAWMREGQNIGQAGKQVSLPPGYEAKENLATARADKAIADFFRDRIKKIDAEFEKVLVREYTEAITKAVKQSRPKAGDNGVRKSTLGAETQKFADTVYRATLLDDEATAKRMAEIEAAINAPDATAEDISALSEEWSILNTFGDLDNRSSETLAQGFNWLKGELQMGREAWRIKEQARIDEQRARVAATIEWLGKGTAKKRNATKTKSELSSDLANHYLLSHASFEQFVTAIFPPEIAARWAEKLRKADEASQTAEIRDRKGILDAVRAGAKAANMSTAEAMLWLKGDQKNAVAYLEDRKVTDERIAIDLAKKIVTGEADRSKLTDADVETLRNELAALPADTQKEFVTIKRVIFRGNDVKLDMSRGKAIQYLLSWNQPDVQIKMRKEGWTDESAADLKALVNDPVSREVMAYAKELYGKGSSIVNPVYSRMFGMNMPQVKNYAPTRFLNAGDTKDIGLDGSPTATGTTPGFAKSRVTHSAKMAPEDALTVMQGHIAQQAHWVNFAELAREFRAMLSNPEVRESIKQAHGESVLKDAELWADQMEQRGGKKASESVFLNTILGAALSGKAVSSLGFNLKTLAMQLENSIRFGLSLDMKQIMSALSDPSTITEDIQTVWESDAIQNRLQGGATAEARFLFSRYAGKPNFAAKIAEASMTPINWLDSAATSISSAIVYRANFNDALKNGMPENLAKQAALEAASKAIYRFAQPVSFGQKSIVENNGNVLSKMFFLFMSDARLKTAIIADAARGLATGRGNASEHRRRILTVELMAVISHVISSAFRDAFSDDDDEEIWNLGGFAKAILLAPLQGFFFAGTVGELAISKLTGQKTFNSTTQNPLLSSMEQAIRAGNNLEDAINFDDPDAMLKEWNNIFRSMALSPAMAAPAVLLNMVKPALGLYQNATTDE